MAKKSKKMRRGLGMTDAEARAAMQPGKATAVGKVTGKRLKAAVASCARHTQPYQKAHCIFIAGQHAIAKGENHAVRAAGEKAIRDAKATVERLHGYDRNRAASEKAFSGAGAPRKQHKKPRR